ncbi:MULTISPECIES: hypothetical protein [Pseudomonas]|uniref:hypothetical protein n=1 Tax=Pseudomonas TaxID=286 RepID=UPI0023065ED2|nr:hypothetical protein [Pseudomonas sp. TUM22785]WCD79247.1 hypothetical protein PI990_25130 [Pseudomonas sp. TUM22785]
MLLRSIPIHNADGQVVNAAILCCFGIAALERDFLLYTLDEAQPGQRCKAYIAEIRIHPEGYSLDTIDAEHWPQVKRVLKELTRERTP